MISSQEYQLNKEVKILFDKEWKPTKLIDSAAYFRLITFRKKNIPLSIINDYFIDGTKQNSFYATYVGIDTKVLIVFF